MLKHKTLYISPELLVEFLRNPTPPGLTAKGMPDDAEIVGASMEDGRTIRLTIRSETFDPISPGDFPPVFTVLYESAQC